MSACWTPASRSVVARAGRPSARSCPATASAASGLRPPDLDAGERADRGVGPGHVGRQPARSHHQQPLGVGAGQMIGGQRRDGCGAAVGQLVAVEHRAQLPGAAVEEQVGGVDGGRGGAGVGREVGDGLDADQLAVDPGRHQQQRALATVGQTDRMHMPLG